MSASHTDACYQVAMGSLASDDALTPSPTTVVTAIERLVAACHPLAIIAFGSRARGQARPDSDLDLFVLLRVATADVGALRQGLRALLADLPFSKDILVSDEATYLHLREQLNSMYQDIAKEGIPLWLDHRLNQPAIEQVCR